MARLIDADALFHEMFFHATSVSVCGTVDEARGMTRLKKICMEDVKKAPTVDAVPVVHGRWIENEGLPYCTCSVCGGNYWFGLYETLKYCPECGARMDGGEENG